jgi:hypothetical protein
MPRLTAPAAREAIAAPRVRRFLLPDRKTTPMTENQTQATHPNLHIL